MQCPDDAEIVAFAEGCLDRERRREIRAHTDVCAECAGLVAEAARLDPTPDDFLHEPAEPLAFEHAGAPPTWGTAVGRYLLLDLLGEGGLGQVFAAYDPDLDRKVAVKLIRPEVTARHEGAELSARLVREAQALAKVRHPNVVAVHDVGTSDGRVFVAMEMVVGSTLRQWLAACPRPWTEIRDVFVAAGHGLAAAHRAGLVHRDFKPGNVLLGDDGRVQVADFGLARAVASPRNEPDDVAARPGTPTSLRATITASGVVLGTPAYMAPEQHLGRTVDARADQFAFCVALYEALLGARPFRGETIDALLEAIESHALAPPERGSRVPRWLHRAVERGLRADPEARFESMAALLSELQVDRRQRRRRGAALAVGALAIVAGAGWVRALWREHDPEAVQRIEVVSRAVREAAARAHFVYPPRREPNAPTAYSYVLELEGMAGPAEALADARAYELRQELAATLVRLGDEYWERPGGAVFAVDYYAAALVFEPDDPHAAQRVRMTPGQRRALEDKAAQRAFSEAELIAAEPLMALAQPGEHARIEALAALYAGTERPGISTSAALETLLGPDAARVFGGATDEGDATVAAAVPVEIAAAPEPAPSEAASRQGRAGPLAAASRRRAPSASEAEPSPSADEHADDPSSSPAMAAALTAEGHAALRQGRLDAAAQAFHGALRHDRRHARALSGLGEVYFQQQAHDKAIEFYERATRAAPRAAAYRLGLGDAYFKVLRYDDALAQYEHARTLGSDRAQRRIDKLRAKLGSAG